MDVRKILPSRDLSAYVRHFLLIETGEDAEHTLLPDTNIVLSFRYRGCVLRGLEEGGGKMPVSAVSGLRKASRKVCYERGAGTFLVVFREGGIGAFCRLEVNELYGRMIVAGDIFEEDAIRDLTERLADAGGDGERVVLVESFLRGCRRDEGMEMAGIVAEGVSAIRRSAGVVRIGSLAASLYISQDAFEKRFRAVVGSSPKQYASIVRLRNLIEKYPSIESLTEASYEAGYFDQSHFIKDFRLFTGRAPREFFKSARYW